MIDHVSLQVTDVDISRAFYEALSAPLGLRSAYTDGPAVGFANGARAPFCLGPATRGEQRELHIAFTAADRHVVHDFYHAAIQAGAEILHRPRLFPEYHPDYFRLLVRDPDGHNIEAVCHHDEQTNMVR